MRRAGTLVPAPLKTDVRPTHIYAETLQDEFSY